MPYFTHVGVKLLVLHIQNIPLFKPGIVKQWIAHTACKFNEIQHQVCCFGQCFRSCNCKTLKKLKDKANT